MPTKRQTRYRYVLAREGDYYTLRCKGALVRIILTAYTTKRQALSLAAQKLKWFYRELGQLSELVVRTERGTYSQPRTYGKDPERHKG